MKQSLTLNESVLVGLLIFGLVFGAGNLIFPVHLGYLSGTNLLISASGFLISAVGLPLLGLVGAALSKKDSLMEMARPVSKRYALFFTTILYLTIGPFFAIPRTCTVAFEVGILPFVAENFQNIALHIFTLIFFLLVLFFSLRPSKILEIVGKYLTPIFLILLSIILIMSFINPIAKLQEPLGGYLDNAFVLGIYEGYNTMDGMATMAFAIIIISCIRKLEIKDAKLIAREILKSGFIMVVLMSIIYLSLIYLGARSTTIVANVQNGSIILSSVSKHYLGLYGSILMALIISFACLKTAIGLVVSCSKMFNEITNNRISYKFLVYLFILISFSIANIGLSKIILFSVPMLRFLYPLSISLIILSLSHPIIKNNKYIYSYTTLFTFAISVIDIFNALSKFIRNNYFIDMVASLKYYVLWFDLGFGWVIPCVLGFMMGIIITVFKGYKES